MTDISRRQAIARISLLLGGTVSAPTLAGLVGGCQTPDDVSAYAWASLDRRSQDLVSAICETIIPETDTPGAIEAGVPQFVDLMLTEWHTDDERTSLLSALDRFDEDCVARYSHPFASCEPDQQSEALADAATGPDAGQMFRPMKELTVVGYYTSEIGATVELHHQEVPGVFNGCVPLDEVGKTWA